MKKILLSVLSIGAVVVVVVFASQAFFSDTETSTGNRFEAGAIDLQIDYSSTYTGRDGEQVEGPGWQLKDLTEAEKFFDLEDVKPGDHGEGTISLHVYNNDAWGCVNLIPTLNDDVSSNEPELEAGDDENTDSIYDGELAQNMMFRVWADMCEEYPGDNYYDEECEGDVLLTEGTGPITPMSWALADSEHPNVFTGLENDPLIGSHTYFIGVEWWIPEEVGNIIQTDKYMADVSFYAEQYRNNPDFVCTVPTQGNGETLTLENETPVEGGPWEIIEDDIYATLSWAGDGPTFNYSLVGQGLENNTQYSLIYYADGWPGNNPGAFIGSGTSDGTGNISFSGTPNLSVDMPMPTDGNYAIGAKIWLVLSSDYNNGNLSTGPMTAWQPDRYLFEGNVYIHYDDTDFTP